MAWRALVVTEARTWLNTPFHHQARLKGVGVDCAMLVRAVGEACGVLTITDEDWKAFAGYGRTPNPRRMEAAMLKFMKPIGDNNLESWQPGDVCWLQWRRDLPMHLAIVAVDGASQPGKPRWTIIHALSTMGRVIEHGFTEEWRDRVHSWWTFPGF